MSPSSAVPGAVLFDLDGTLTDPAEGICGSFRHALASVGHPVGDEVDLRWMIGPAIVDNFNRRGVADGVPRSKAVIVADALAQLGGPETARVVMVGDRRHDIEGGRANGCPTIAVTWGFAEPGELARCAPDRVVETPEQLAALLAAWPPTD